MTRKIAFLDSCVLYPFSLRDLLIQFASDGLYQAKWSDLVESEVTRNVEEDYPSTKGKLRKTFSLMEAAVPDFLAVATSETLQELSHSSTDAKDCPILAAAIDSQCTHLITSNLKHFDIAYALARGVLVINADEFLVKLIAEDPLSAKISLDSILKRYKNPPRSRKEYCDLFAENFPKTAEALSFL